MSTKRTKSRIRKIRTSRAKQNNGRARKRVAHRRSSSRKRQKKQIRGRANRFELVTLYTPRGLGANSGGQSGDTQGLSEVARTDSESVEELMEEGQSFEAEVLQGVEGALDADQSEVYTREERADDVPEEYRERD